MASNYKSLKLHSLVNGHDHSGTMKSMPSRKHVCSVKGIGGEARGYMEKLFKCRCAGVATIENELSRINQNDPTASWPVPTTKKVKSF